MARRQVRDALLATVQRVGGTRVGVLTIGRVFSPLQRWLYRITAGRVSLTGGAPVLLLTTTGRRSGMPRTVPLLYVRDRDRLVICNVNPGFERPNPWTLNLRAESRAQIQVGADTFAVTSREATSDELDQYWPRLTSSGRHTNPSTTTAVGARSSSSSRRQCADTWIESGDRFPAKCVGSDEIHALPHPYQRARPGRSTGS